MSLRVRLVCLILALVAWVTVSLSALELKTLVDSLTSQAIERGDLAGNLVRWLMVGQRRLASADAQKQVYTHTKGQSAAYSNSHTDTYSNADANTCSVRYSKPICRCSAPDRPT